MIRLKRNTQVNFRARRLDTGEWGTLDLTVILPAAPTREITASGAWRGDSANALEPVRASLRFAGEGADLWRFTPVKSTTKRTDVAACMGAYMALLWHRLQGEKNPADKVATMWSLQPGSDPDAALDESKVRTRAKHPDIAHTVALIEAGRYAVCDGQDASGRAWLVVLGQPIAGRQVIEGEGDSYRIRGDYRALVWAYGARDAAQETIRLDISGSAYMIERLL